MKLWLDDMRPAPEGWVWVRTVAEAIEVLEGGKVNFVSLDNDLGAYEEEGYHVADWIEGGAVCGMLGRMRMTAHTRDMAARDRMKAAFRNAREAWDKEETSRRVGRKD